MSGDAILFLILVIVSIPFYRTLDKFVTRLDVLRHPKLCQPRGSCRCTGRFLYGTLTILTAFGMLDALNHGKIFGVIIMALMLLGGLHIIINYPRDIEKTITRQQETPAE